MQVMKNKTLAVWLTFLLGPLGMHRFYLYGFSDKLGWVLPLPTALGWYGIQRALAFGQDDLLSWILIPLIGFTFAGCALNAIVYGLLAPEKWHSKFNAGATDSDQADTSNWVTIFGVATALLMGTTILMASIVFSFQRYFEHQIEEAKAISQGTVLAPEKQKP
jgi:hypothetical protein